VVPVFNEEESVALYVQTTRGVLEAAGLDFEIVFINDGSCDGTHQCLMALAEADKRVRIINLSRNFGKELALTAGIDHAVGDVLVPMDVDLQDPPELILKFLEKWREGYDVVYGVRSRRKYDSLAKRTTAAMFYRIFNSLSPLKVPANAGDFRLIDRRVADVIRQMPERNRFMKGLFAWVGFKSVGVPYERPQRASGSAKWGNWRLWNFALDGLFSFSTLPLRVWTYIGGIVALLSFSYGSFIVILALTSGIDIPGYASLLTVVLFLGGLQLLSIGVLGEYLGRLFIEVKGRPLYIVESTYPPASSQQAAVNITD
jgi:glycosyltransferase involved in cell wall biosynthesis